MIKIIIGIVIVLASIATIPSMSGGGSYLAGAVLGKLVVLTIGILLIYSGAKSNGAK